MVPFRLLRLCLRSSCRVASSLGAHRRGLNHQAMHFCGYSRSKNPRDWDKTNLPVATGSLPSWSLKNYVIRPNLIISTMGFLAAPSYFVGFGAGVWLIHHNDERRAITGANQVKRFERNPQGIWPYGGPFRLVNTENELVTEATLRGNWILMYFGYTSSPDVGPEEVQKMAEVIDILEHRHNQEIIPVFISIDPQRDSLHNYGLTFEEFHPKIVGLTGPVTAVRQIAQEFRIFFRKVEEEGQDYLVESTNDMILLNPKMEIVGRFGVQYGSEQLSDAILKEVKKEAK